MKKLKLFLIAVVLTSIIASCDDRLDQLQVLNQEPSVEFKKADSLTANLSDSLRLIPGKKNVYNINLKVSDPNKNIQFLNWEITKGTYKLYYQNNEVMLPNSFRTDYGDIFLNFYPDSVGNYAAEFKATDRFGKIAVGKFNLYVFENLLPVANLKVTAVSEESAEYIIDGSASFDPDSNFQGEIVNYEFSIDGTIVNLKNPTLRYVFEGSGGHTVTLKVMDNSGGISNTVNSTINIK
jgi:hypothetical protein